MFTLPVFLFSLLHHLLVYSNLTISLKEKQQKGFVISNMWIFFKKTKIFRRKTLFLSSSIKKKIIKNKKMLLDLFHTMALPLYKLHIQQFCTF